MRRVAALLLALLVLLGAGLWYGPRLLDWDAWHGQLTEIASARLGRRVAVDGPITLVLLPQPRLEAARIAIGPDADGLTITARSMRLRLDLPALLTGRLEPRELALVGGEISLPWPPTELPSFRPPPWLTTLDARLEDSRLTVGGLRLEGLNARLSTGGLTESLVAEGRFAWRGLAVRFSGNLGRAGFDGIAPLDLSLAVAGNTLIARGVLAPGGGFEGRVEATGTDLSTLVPAPPLAFRATGRLTASADLLAADELTLDLGGQPARGAVTLRLAPAPRLDIALTAGRLDLDAWIAALRPARSQTLPVSIDLSAEATSFGPIPLRRLRGAAFLEGERMTLSDVSAVLPGDTEIELTGATARSRLELAIRFAGANLRETLAAFGLPLGGTDPARLRQAEGRFRLALQENEATISDLVASIDGARLSGAGVVRQGARPAIGVGVTLDRLDLDGLLPELPDAAAISAWLSGFDLNLRVAAERLRWQGLAAERGTLDATLENGRVALRRLALRFGELDIAASGAALLGPTPRFPDVSLELSGASGAALAPLLPPGLAALAPLTAQQVALRLTGGGVPEAVALKAEGDLGELRLEASATLDAVARRGNGTLTLRHPGAPRLLGRLGAGPVEWLGEGSLAIIANLSGQANTQGTSLTAEHLDVVAGGLRARGQLTLAAGAARPKLTGRIAAELLPLPWPGLRAAEPLGLEQLAGFDAELAVEAARILPQGEPASDAVLEAASATLKLAEGTLRLEGIQARIGSGTLRGGLTLEGSASPPRLGIEVSIADAALTGPLFGLPFDLGAGQLEASTRITASGHSLAALAATAEGRLELTARDGVLIGLDLGAAQAAAALPELDAAEAALQGALGGGASAFERLEVAGPLAEGRLRLETTRLVPEYGGEATTATGEIDLARGTLDLRLLARPVAEAPEIGLRLTGPASAPRRQPELAPFLRWKAEQ